MIPGAFDYQAPDSLDEAIRLLAADEDAKALAGGHSLLPLMKLRLADPSLLVDLRKIEELRGISNGSGLRVGALTRHVDLQNGDYGIVTAAAKKIADQQVRNRGTIGGSIAHGDPASDLPTVLLAADGSVDVKGPGGGRSIAAKDLYVDYLTTSLQQGEIVTHVNFPSLDGFGYAYEKFTRRSEDWAMVGVVALVKASGDTVEDARVAFTHMGGTPLRAPAVEDALRGQPKTAEAFAAAAENAAEGTDPPSDLNATPEYKKHLARVLTRRALTTAAGL
jgi:carbon-monoxide dehydrogenase medium subunit